MIAWRPPAGSYDGAFRRALAAAVEQHRAMAGEREEAGQFARRMAEQPQARRELAVRNRVRNWWAAQALVDEAWGLVVRDPQDAVQLTALALEIAGSLDGSIGRLPLVADLVARAERVRAAALRRLGDLTRAGAALRRAWHSLRRGSGDPRERSLHLLARGALLAAQGRRR
ncbi:MAG TPA: hypothetical protein VHQ65_17235, partial [Thermoanaerobaculia bacterium]|nr:hypothetical protein [Thermoanaerobaculia bacterium]